MMGRIFDDDKNRSINSFDENFSGVFSHALRFSTKRSFSNFRQKCRKNNDNAIHEGVENKYNLIKKMMLESVEESQKSALESLFKQLESVSVAFLRESDHAVDGKMIDNGAFNLLQIFSKYTDLITEKHSNRLLLAFGPFSAVNAKSAHYVVEQIRNMLPGNQRNLNKNVRTRTPSWERRDLRGLMKYLLGSDYEGRHSPKNGGDGTCEARESDVGLASDSPLLFGDNIKFASRLAERIIDYGVAYSNGMKNGQTTEDRSIYETSSSSNFMKYDRRNFTQPVDNEENVAESGNFSGVFSLIERLRGPSDSADANELCRSIVALLESEKRDEELQNDLFELLGFDNFDLIEDILQNRLKIVHDFHSLLEGSASLHSERESAMKLKKFSLASGPAAFGQTIIVASEREHQLAKELRKTDKRYRRLQDKGRQKGIGANQDFDEFTNVDVLRQEELRREYEVAQRTPLFSRSQAVPDYSRYPFVFDSSLAVRNSASCIAGNKILLPDSVKRNDNKMYEEITIEPNPPPPTDIGSNRIKINELDKISQEAFRNTKQLNQIQTVVFEKADKSNSNLLICAPTGAGKTNIAMLCVLNVVKQYIRKDVILKDQFKIIYVAPMKALAAEMVRNFGSRLEPLGIVVKELTGDMQLTKQEIMQTQMIVTTPEKWDVVTRKSTGDVALTQLVRLLIIDEIHLLHDDRGAVIESLVARTLRQVEMTQNLIRIVGLSATLPNYIDVAQFLRVNPMEGLFFFDGRFRPVPLGQRNATGRTAASLKEMANNKGHSTLFIPENTAAYGLAQKMISKSRNRQLIDLFNSGFCIHHAGLLRSDRNIVEKLFAEGHIKVLCCTATLAWGVNLPAHAVIIKGTNIYDAKRSSFVDLGILDVQQIFGRAGRPQFDKSGFGLIITTHNKLPHYLSLLTRQLPIESQFINSLLDNLNAEIVLGTVSNVQEAVEWLSYTYLYVRMRKNPMAYGIQYNELMEDNALNDYRARLVKAAAAKLDSFKMIRFDATNECFYPTDIGRIASYYYIKSETIEVINQHLKDFLTDDAILALVSQSTEFNEIKVREEEMDELGTLYRHCHLPALGGAENTHGKVNILMQAHISKLPLDNFSLISDMSYVVQNVGRILRSLFDMAVRRNNASLAAAILNLCKSVEQQLWHNADHPLAQMCPSILRYEVIRKLVDHKLKIDQINEMTAEELSHMTRSNGHDIKAAAARLPNLDVQSRIKPITRSVLRVYLTITPDYVWDDRVHGRGSELFHIWVEDPETFFMYHREEFLLTKRQVIKKETQEIMFTVPITEPMPSQYLVKWVSDRWIGSGSTHTLFLTNIILPERHPPHTALLNLQPLSVAALGNQDWQNLYKFKYFNAVQTQIFHCLFHTDENALVGAPTGSGKTVAAELAIFRIFKENPDGKIVYIAPMKALVRERIRDWKERIERTLHKSVVELTGDITPDIQALSRAQLIVTTPEKWDGISRSWQNRGYVREVALIIIDEIHLLGEDRGPVLEVIVSRTNFISSNTKRKVRIVGLSTALANARDLADWLSIKQIGLYNFQPSVRPVPLEVHISGFSEKHYCPRMATMNKPAFRAIRTHSKEKPVLIFVSSRRQTRLTALDLIAHLAGSDSPKQWLHMPEEEIDQIIQTVKDASLKLTLSFGIGMHHAGLHENDRRVCEELYGNQKIQVLLATATLAWGVNFPAHLVIIKGTEYYDGKTRRYVDFPITDVLQMMGRAGRPQYDNQGVAVVFVHDIKKEYYKKFLYEPFPVESNLLNVLPDHLNAEIVAGTIKTKQQAMDYLTWTYFFRRALINPTYYGLNDVNAESVGSFLTSVIENTLTQLEASYCVSVAEDNRSIVPENLGRIASYYYLQHKTVKLFHERLNANCEGDELLKILTDVPEYDEIPVRHNEDSVNSDLAKLCPISVNPGTYDDSHTKAHLLYQAHFSRLKLPCTDYETDLRSVLDQSIRILQAMLDVAAEQGWLATSIKIAQLMQMVVQARWVYDSSLSTLPHIEPQTALALKTDSIPELQLKCHRNPSYILEVTRGMLDPVEVDSVQRVLKHLPILNVQVSVSGFWQRGVSSRNIKLQNTNVTNATYTPLHCDQEYTLSITIDYANKRPDNHAYAPKFPKAKDEGWFLMLGDLEVAKGDLLALKRVASSFSSSRTPKTVAHRLSKMKTNSNYGRISTCLSFRTPDKPSTRKIYTLFLMSDSYLGLDMQYDLYFDIADKAATIAENQQYSTMIVEGDL